MGLALLGLGNYILKLEKKTFVGGRYEFPFLNVYGTAALYIGIYGIYY